MTSIRNTSKAVTRRLNRIENSVKSKLSTFYKRKIKPNVALYPIETFKAKYEREVKTIIRKAIQEAYLTGTDIVSDKITEKDKEFTSFISVTDVQNIQSLTNKMSDQFWTTTSKLVRREQEFILDNATQELIKKKSFDDDAAMIGLGALFAYSGFNAAIKSKMQNIPILAQQTQPVALTTDGLSSFDIDVGFDIERLDPFNLPLEGRVLFLTQEDALVDQEICEPLNRTVYEVTDPDIPTPPLHRFCRCRLIPVVDESTEIV